MLSGYQTKFILHIVSSKIPRAKDQSQKRLSAGSTQSIHSKAVAAIIARFLRKKPRQSQGETSTSTNKIELQLNTSIIWTI